MQGKIPPLRRSRPYSAGQDLRAAAAPSQAGHAPGTVAFGVAAKATYGTARDPFPGSPRGGVPDVMFQLPTGRGLNLNTPFSPLLGLILRPGFSHFHRNSLNTETAQGCLFSELIKKKIFIWLAAGLDYLNGCLVFLC